jgi:hypothetical protein
MKKIKGIQEAYTKARKAANQLYKNAERGRENAAAFIDLKEATKHLNKERLLAIVVAAEWIPKEYPSSVGKLNELFQNNDVALPTWIQL